MFGAEFLSQIFRAHLTQPRAAAVFYVILFIYFRFILHENDKGFLSVARRCALCAHSRSPVSEREQRACVRLALHVEGERGESSTSTAERPNCAAR